MLVRRARPRRCRRCSDSPARGQRQPADERRKHPGAAVEIWADELRIGLKAITRGAWAPIGERPVALGHHRFEWLYVRGFVEPATGRTVWNVSNGISSTTRSASAAVLTQQTETSAPARSSSPWRRRSGSSFSAFSIDTRAIVRLQLIWVHGLSSASPPRISSLGLTSSERL